MTDEIFTTSVIVQTLPEHFSEVCYSLGTLPDTHFGFLERASGKIIVLLEVESMQRIQQWIDSAREFHGVLSVTMVYQHAEQESSLDEVIA